MQKKSEELTLEVPKKTNRNLIITLIGAYEYSGAQIPSLSIWARIKSFFKNL